MKKVLNYTRLAMFFSLACLTTARHNVALAQDKPIQITGSVQSDMMIAPETDDKIGATKDGYDNDAFLMNTYVDLMLQSKYVDAGARVEFMQWPMPGFQDAQNDNKFRGYGVPHAWAKLKLKNVDITAGTFYEQFGSGFILRLYEERSLGIDNSLLGVRVKARPFKGVSLTALSGIQRNYWDWDNNLVSGADAEISLDEYVKPLREHGYNFTVGGSWTNVRLDNEVVRKKDTPMLALNMPEFVNAFDVRMRLQKGGLSLLGEYAQKSQNPDELNNYIYGKGTAAMISASYVKSGLSLLAQAKRSENMGFRTQRTLSKLCKSCYVNHLPAFTVDQTYALPALYPYATQTDGEWAFQYGVGYKLKGRMAPKFKLNYSLVRGLEHNQENQQLGEEVMGTDGIKNSFFKMGDVYYQDLNLMYEQKLSKRYEHHVMYMYQQYNRGVIQEGSGNENIYSNIFVYEGKVKLNKKNTLRFELQSLLTQHESGNWWYGLAEWSLVPHLMVSLSDMYGKVENNGGEYGEREHFYKGAVTYNIKNHRIMLSYGRTRAGFNCTGGVCRFVPANKGFTLNYNYNF